MLTNTSSRAVPLAATSPARVEYWALAVVASLIALLARALFLKFPFELDSGIYAQMARTLAERGMAFGSFFETKLPSTAITLWPLYLLFHSWWPGYVFAQALLLLGSLAVFCAFVPVNHAAKDRFLLFVFLTLVLNGTYFVLRGLQLESFIVGFQLLSLTVCTCAVHRKSLGLGFLGGLLAVWPAGLKPAAGGVALGAVVACIVLAWSARTPWWRSRTLYGLLLGSAIGLLLHGLILVRFTTDAERSLLFSEMADYAAGTPLSLKTVVKLVVYGSIGLIPFASVIVAQPKPVPRSREHPTDRALLAASAVWLICEILAFLMQKRGYCYYALPLIASAAITAWAAWGLGGKHSALLVIAVGLGVQIGSHVYYSRWAINLPSNKDIDSIAGFLKDRAVPGERLVSDIAYANLLMRCRLEPGLFVSDKFVFANHPQVEHTLGRRALEVVRTTPPVWVVVDPAFREQAQRQNQASGYDRVMTALYREFVSGYEQVYATPSAVVLRRTRADRSGEP